MDDARIEIETTLAILVNVGKDERVWPSICQVDCGCTMGWFCMEHEPLVPCNEHRDEWITEGWL